MKKVLFLLLLSATVSFSQWNVDYEIGTIVSDDSLFVDLGVDQDYLYTPYGSGAESRAIGIYLHGTWTNDSLQVYAAIHPDSTYVPVYYDEGLMYEVGTTGNCIIMFNPSRYLGLRYIMFKLPANEGGTRIYAVLKRQY